MDEWVWGIDPSTRRVAIGWVGADRGAAVRDFGSKRGAMRLAHIYQETFDFALELAAERPPLAVWVEQASGARPNPQLLYAVGVIQAAVFAALSPLQAFPLSVDTIPSATWKKQATGFGRRTPDEYLAWAQTNGYEGDDFDCAAALGVATAAGRMISFGPALAQLTMAA
jgi:hypothetical protein